MASYRLSGVLLASEIPLDRYAPAAHAAGGAPDVTVRRASPAHQPRLPSESYTHTIEVDGEPFLSVAKDGDERLLRMHGCADFRIEAGAARVTCTPVPGCAEDVVGQAVVDRLLPHLLSQRGVPTVHASVVELEDGSAVGFVGDPGAGKSTLAAALTPPAKLLCDDCAALEIRGGRALIHPSYGFVRLRRDAATALGEDPKRLARTAQRTVKWRLPRPAATLPRPLRHLYSLVAEEHGPATIERLGRRDAIAELARHLYRLDPTDRSRLGRELVMLEELTQRVGVAWLRYPRSFEALSQVAHAVLADAAHEAATPIGSTTLD